MQRIPNPVSDIDIFVRVFRDLYKHLKDKSEFGLDDISSAMIACNNVTSQGAIGDEALRRSTRKDRSRDPIYNQAKMYAELFRTLGWMMSTTSKLTYTFSLLGIHIGTAHNPKALVCECLLGIAYPNETLGVKSDQTVRVIGGILLTLAELRSITRDEMMAGPMSIQDDSNKKSFNEMLQELKNCRTKPGRLDALIDAIAARRKITRNPTMTNYTRIPVAVCPWAGWGIKSGSVIKVTDEGQAMAKRLRDGIDFRLADFNKLPDDIKSPFIRKTFYSMLERAGFDITPVFKTFTNDVKTLRRHRSDLAGDVFFSPFQQLDRETIRKWAPELLLEEKTTISKRNLELAEKEYPKRGERIETTISFGFKTADVEEKHFDNQHIKSVKTALKNCKTVEEAITKVYEENATANKTSFYPFVGELFRLIGFDCRVSRGGQNYERADAIIFDNKQSIPIEIKSPGEETEISVKGIRQALENKIILLSRKNYPTDFETTTLVVGYNPPNERSEVYDLVKDVKKAFGVRIGILDFKSLLRLAVHSLTSGKKIQIKDFHLLEGLICVKNFVSKNEK